MTLQIDFLPWDCGMKLGRLAIPCGYWTYRRTDRPTVLSISRTLVLEGLIVLCERWLRSSPSDQTCRFRVSTLALYSAPRWCKMYFLECVYTYIYILCIYVCIYILCTYIQSLNFLNPSDGFQVNSKPSWWITSTLSYSDLPDGAGL